MKSLIVFGFALLFSFSLYSQSSKVELLGQEIMCEKESISYYENGSLKKCKLSEEQKIQELGCIGWISFYKNGKIQSCILSFPQYIQSIPIKSGEEHPLMLYPNGKPKEFTLSRTVYLFDTKYKKNSRIQMDLTGKVKVVN